jgi:hypothetical protein
MRTRISPIAGKSLEQGVDERAASDAEDAGKQPPWLRRRRAEPDPLSLADFRSPSPQRSRFVRVCYKNWLFVIGSPARG